MRRKILLKLISKFKEFHKMQCSRIWENVPVSRILVDKLRSEYQTESIVADLGKGRKFNRFSEESKGTIQRLGNIELCELEKLPRQHNAKRAHSLEGLLYGPCGACFMPTPEQQRKIQSQFGILSIAYYVVKTDCSRGSLQSERCKTPWAKEKSQS